MENLLALSEQLRAGRLRSRALLERCLSRIEDPAGEGERVFLRVDREAALAAADAVDNARQRGETLPPLAGIPFSVKDLFDVAGQVTTAGSRVLRDAPPAAADAPVVAWLRAHGMIPIGRVNMSEFAYSGLGLNPHHGTPRSVWQREIGRAPGGSSSGSAVCVADGMVPASLGSDTGGSCRIPAAFNGVVGFKPSTGRLSTDGVYPLSQTLDAPGPFAASAADCRVLDAAMRGGDVNTALAAEAGDVCGLRIAVPRTVLHDAVDPAVANAFEEALARLAMAGAVLVERDLPELATAYHIYFERPLVAYEAWQLHGARILARGDEYDPIVCARMRVGESVSAAEYSELLALRGEVMRAAAALLAEVDLIAAPTVPILPPRLDELADEAAFARANRLCLRNTSTVNLFDGCAISLPCQAPGEASVGLMLAGPHGGDVALLEAAMAVEAALAQGWAAGA